MRLAPNYFSKAIPLDQGDDLASGINQADVIIEFAHHCVTPTTCKLAINALKPLVIGTTGHMPEELEEIRQTALTIPTVFSANYSVGVNLLFRLTEIAASILKDKGYDQEIIEMHHRHKVDAPSGTANKLLNILLQINALNSENVRHGRQGETGARPPKEIGVHAIRGGDVVGEHTVIFAAFGERIELTHKASSRDIFASGALLAAQWLLNKAPEKSTIGSALQNRPYDMQDVLGFN